MSKLSHYIKLRSGPSGCNAKQFECDKYLDCDSCLEDKIKEHDKQIRAEAINDYYLTLNEKINTDTNLKDTIREIHDNVAREMYCKGIDDLTEKLKEMANNSSTKYIRLSEKETITTYGVEQIAEELKAGVKNEID